MNKIFNKLILLPLCITMLSSCDEVDYSEDIIEDYKVAASFTIDAGESITIKTNTYYEILELNGNNTEGKNFINNFKYSRTKFTQTLRMLSEKIIGENEAFILSFDATNKEDITNYVTDYYVSKYTNPFVIMNIPSMEEIEQEILDLSSNYGYSLAYSTLLNNLNNIYPDLEFNELRNQKISEIFSLISYTNNTTFKKYKFHNFSQKAMDETDKNAAINYAKETYKIDEINDENYEFKSYIYNEKRYSILGIFKDNLFIILKYINGQKILEKSIELPSIVDGKETLNEYNAYMSSIVEPMVNEICARELGYKFGGYRDYIYDFLTYNGRFRITSLGVKPEHIYLPYILDQIDISKDSIDSFIVKHYTIDAKTKYYISILTSNTDIYVVYGNSCSAEATKCFKNGENIAIKLVVEDSGFSMSAISHLTRRGQY